MKLLLDTHIILWAAGQPDKLSDSARKILADTRNTLFFSTASIWEIVIKRGLGRDDFKVDPYRLRKIQSTSCYADWKARIHFLELRSQTFKSFLLAILLVKITFGIFDPYCRQGK